MSLSEPLGGLVGKPYEEIHALEARSRMDAGAILDVARKLAGGKPAVWG